MSLYEENETTLAPPNEFRGGTQGFQDIAASGGGYAGSVASTLEKLGF